MSRSRIDAAPLPADAVDAVEADATASGWYALTVLVVATLFSVSDRYIFSLLAEPIRVSMGLSDIEIGLLQGFGLSLFAAIVSFPIGWLADRYDRRVILAGCVAVWSLGVVGCGLAQTFPTLFFASAVVGAGEAGLIPIVYGLIPELFRNRKRAVANATYSATVKLGVSLGVAACGWLVFAVERHRASLPGGLPALDVWRLGFFGAALPALIVIPLILSIRLPRRASRVVASDGRGRHALLPWLRQERRTIVPFLVGVGFLTFGGIAAITWVPMIVMRAYHETPQAVGSGLALSNLVGTVVGFVLAVYGLRYLTPRLGPMLPIRVLVWSAFAAAVTSAMLLGAHDAASLYTLQAVQTVFTMAGQMVFPTVLQDLAPSHLRSRIASLSYMTSVVLGAASPVIVGALSDRLKANPDGLLIAAMSTAVVGLLISTACLRWSQTTYLRTVLAARAGDPATA